MLTVFIIALIDIAFAAGTNCTSVTPDCIKAVAQSYTDALPGLGVDTSTMRLADNVIRWQNNLVTSQSASDVRADASDGFGSTLSLSYNYTKLTLGDDNHTVYFRCVLYVSSGTPPLEVTLWTVFINDEIYVDWGIGACGSNPANSPCITKINVLQVLVPLRKEIWAPAPSGSNVPAPLFFSTRAS